MSYSKLAIGIVGLPNVGKSTLFNVLTRKGVPAENYPFCTIDPSVGVVEVPDERLNALSRSSKSAKTVPAIVEFVDIAGLVKGAAEGEGLGNQFLSHIREVDAIAQVVRLFQNDKIVHVHNKIDPLNDIEIVEAELILADLATVAKRISSITKELKTGKKEAIKEKEVLEKTKSILESGKSASSLSLSEAEFLTVKGLHLLTMKPIIYLYNFADGQEIPEELKKRNYVSLDIKLEEDLLDMSDDEKKEFGVKTNLSALIDESYKLLDLITFFTTGEDETRAWTISAGSTAPEAGAAIHTDFQEKFIRAEVVSYDDLMNLGSLAAAREKGLLRTEGKEYIVKDGDVIEFLAKG